MSEKVSALVEFFREEAAIWGNQGDLAGWSTEETAIHCLREYRQLGLAKAGDWDAILNHIGFVLRIELARPHFQTIVRNLAGLSRRQARQIIMDAICSDQCLGVQDINLILARKRQYLQGDGLLEYIEAPVLTDIQVHAVGFNTYDVQPAHLPDLFAQRPVIVFGKWRGPVAGTFELQGKTGRGEFVTRLDVAEVQPDGANSALGYLWARSRIAELSDYGSRNVDADRVKEITSLGLKYSLLTQYTSFIAVREVVTNPDGSAKDVNQPLPLPLGVSDLAVGGDTESGDEPELIWLAGISLMIVITIVLRRRRLFV